MPIDIRIKLSKPANFRRPGGLSYVHGGMATPPTDDIGGKKEQAVEV